MSSIRIPERKSVTTNDILLSITGGRQKYSSPEEMKKLMIEKKEQMEEELKIINRSYSACYTDPKVDKKMVQRNLPGLDAKELKTEVTQKFYDSEVMNAALCVANSIYFDTGSGMLEATERIRNYIINLIRVGGESVSGFALSAGLKGGTSPSGIDQEYSEDGEKFFVVKAPQSSDNDQELVHEVVVAMFLNAVRRYVPNFAVVYGAFKCSPPIIGSDKKVVAWCNNMKNPVYYALYEFVPAKKSANDIFKTCDFNTFMSMFLQVLYALEFAYDYCGFTHYDLHTDNVLAEEVNSGKPIWIKYPPPLNAPKRSSRWVLAPEGLISMIIDYGMSHVIGTNLSDKPYHYGHVGASYPLNSFFIYRDRSHSMHDAYKFLLFSLSTMYYANNNKCFNQAGLLLNYFNTQETAADIIQKQRQYYYSYPLDEKVKDGDISAFINHIETNIDCSQFLTANNPVNGDILVSSVTEKKAYQILQDVKAITPSIPIPQSFIGFYDVMSQLGDEMKRPSDSKVNENEWIRLASRFEQNFDSVWEKEQKKVTDYMKIVENPPEILPLPVQTSKLFELPSSGSIVYFDRHKEYISNLGRYLDTLQRINISLKAIQYVAQAFTDKTTELMRFANNISQRLSQQNNYIKNLRESISETYSYFYPTDLEKIEQINNVKKFAQDNDEYGQFLRYWSDWNIIHNIISTL